MPSLRISLSLLAVIVFASAGQVGAITLEEYVSVLREHHPIIQREALSEPIARKQQDSLLGTADWVVTADPSYSYDDSISPSFGSPDEVRTTVMDVGLQKSFWDTGGTMDLGYTYENRDATLSDAAILLNGGASVNVAGPADYFANSVSLSYSQPLLKNRGGTIDSLPYDLQGIIADQAALTAAENTERFVLEQSLRFLDWLLADKQKTIAEERLELARKDLLNTKDRYDANLIESVDYFRAEESVIATEQALKRAESQYASIAAELSRQSGIDLESGEHPVIDIDAPLEIADAGEVSAAISTSRVLRVYDLQVSYLEREQAGLLSERDADLDLVLFGNLKDGDETYADSTGFNHPGAGVALAFRYPLSNRRARSNLERNTLQTLQVREDRESARLSLESAAAALLAEIRDLGPILELNRKRMQIADETTKAEQDLYLQGRNQFTFVIQSQDSAALARLAYVENQIALRRHAAQLEAIMDRLVP